MLVSEAYAEACNRPSDINEHLPILFSYGQWCKTITEFGVREGVSTMAWIKADPKYLILYECSPDKPTMRKIAELCDSNNIKLTVHKKRTEEPPQILPTNLLFIDTQHTYSQLILELELHAPSVIDYIILHDTETFGLHGEKAPMDPGLSLAISEFCSRHQEWVIHQHFKHNNGLTVLRRRG